MSNLKTFWIVRGNTGEYSDQCFWSVRGFATEEKAKAFTEQLLNYVRGSINWSTERQNTFVHPLDPQCYVNYSGTDYTYYSVEIDLDE